MAGDRLASASRCIVLTFMPQYRACWSILQRLCVVKRCGAIEHVAQVMLRSSEWDARRVGVVFDREMDISAKVGFVSAEKACCSL